MRLMRASRGILVVHAIVFGIRQFMFFYLDEDLSSRRSGKVDNVLELEQDKTDVEH